MTEVKKYHPTKAVAENAKKGLELHEKFNRGGTEVGIERAKHLSRQGALDFEDIQKMTSYFARHTVDKQGKDFDNKDKPSNGYIAWLLWGGDAGQEWADKIKSEHESKQ